MSNVFVMILRYNSGGFEKKDGQHANFSAFDTLTQIIQRAWTDSFLSGQEKKYSESCSEPLFNPTLYSNTMSESRKKSKSLACVTQEEKRRVRLKSQQEARSQALDRKRAVRADVREEEEGFEMLGGDGVKGEERQEEVQREDEYQELEMDVTTATRLFAKCKPKKEKAEFNLQDYLTSPESMLEVPVDLASSWSCMARPFGKRCLLSSSCRGMAVSKTLDGNILHTFASDLPRDCVLDCVFSEEQDAYIVCDLLKWKGADQRLTTREFRCYWLQTKLSEIDVSRVTSTNECAIRSGLFYSCADRQSLMTAYEQAQVAHNQAGLLFFHNESDYERGLTPLVLLWHDQYTWNTRELQAEEASLDISLKISPADCTSQEGKAAGGGGGGYSFLLRTSEGIPLATLTFAELQAICQGRQGDTPAYVRCNIQGAFYTEGGQSMVQSLAVKEAIFDSACLSDCWSRILFDSRALGLGEAASSEEVTKAFGEEMDFSSSIATNIRIEDLLQSLP